MTWRDVRALAVRGVASGAGAWAVMLAARKLGFQNSDLMPGLQLGAPSLAPGLVFGLAIGGYLARRSRLAGARVAGYLLASGVSYYVAYHVAYNIVAREWLGGGFGSLIAAGVIAGFCGSALLALLAMPLLRTGIHALRLSLAVGAIAGA